MSLGVIKEWSCLEHGEFEASHPICPARGCKSRSVVREFRTAPKTRSRMVRQFDAGIRRTSDLMRLNNLRTARANEAAFGGDVGARNGQRVLWGDECRQVLGRSFGELTGLAARPLAVKSRGNPDVVLPSPPNNGVAGAANEGGITQNRFMGKPIPTPVDNQASRKDARSMAALGQKSA